MPTIPAPPSDTSSDPTPPCANAHVDGCPECVKPPEHVEQTPRGCAAYYRCHDCGAVWETSWGCA